LEINLALTKPGEYAAKLEKISTTLKGRKAKVRYVSIIELNDI